ncbi:hypothetical protein D3C86_1483890 [compost metagenome]
MQTDIGNLLLSAGIGTANEMNAQLLIKLDMLIQICSNTDRTLLGLHESQVAEFIAGAGDGAADEVLGGWRQPLKHRGIQ